jgi:hypothetical protein
MQKLKFAFSAGFFVFLPSYPIDLLGYTFFHNNTQIKKLPLTKPGLAGPSNVIRSKVWKGSFLSYSPF